MGGAVDTSLVRMIQQDQAKLGLILLGAIAFAAVGVWLVTGHFPDTGGGALAPYAGWTGMVFFGAVAVLLAWRLLKPASMTLSTAGIDYNGSFTPWVAVRSVNEQSIRRQKFVRLALDELLAPLPRRSISAGALRISHHDLLQLVNAYAQAHSKHMRGDTPDVADYLIAYSRRQARQQ